MGGALLCSGQINISVVVVFEFALIYFMPNYKPLLIHFRNYRPNLHLVPLLKAKLHSKARSINKDLMPTA